MENKDVKIYRSADYRVLENSHILLWLVKDTCWAMEFKTGGIAMIFPTLFMAIYLLWRSRRGRAEFFHNIAVCLWILANSTWMVGEFAGVEARPYAVVLFAIGLGVLAFYYVVYFRRDRRGAGVVIPDTESTS